MRLPALALAAALAAGPAAAHDFWIQPKQFHVAPAAATPMTLQVGHGPQRQRSPIPAGRILRFAAIGPDGAATDLRAGLHPGGAAEDGQIRLPGGGAYIVVLQTDDGAQSHLPALRFNDYLQAEGLTPALDLRRHTHREQADGSERYSRIAKALVEAGPGGGRVTRPLGLPLEITPLADPYAEGRPARLPVQVLYKGRPLAGALVKLTDLAHDAAPVETHRTDAAGRAAFDVPRHGDWLLNVIWTQPTGPRDEVDFETVFSSLSFGFAPTGVAVAGR